MCHEMQIYGLRTLQRVKSLLLGSFTPNLPTLSSLPLQHTRQCAALIVAALPRSFQETLTTLSNPVS